MRKKNYRRNSPSLFICTEFFDSPVRFSPLNNTSSSITPTLFHLESPASIPKHKPGVDSSCNTVNKQTPGTIHQRNSHLKYSWAERKPERNWLYAAMDTQQGSEASITQKPGRYVEYLPSALHCTPQVYALSHCSPLRTSKEKNVSSSDRLPLKQTQKRAKVFNVTGKDMTCSGYSFWYKSRRKNRDAMEEETITGIQIRWQGWQRRQETGGGK